MYVHVTIITMYPFIQFGRYIIIVNITWMTSKAVSS
jgi:hypothetical protein